MNFPFNNSLKKAKRVRSAFTTDQIHGLEKEFKKFPYIGIVNRKEIANSLNISERAVKVWFQNRRMKEKKDAFQKEFHNYDQIQLDAKKFVNDQLNNVNTMKLNGKRNLNLTQCHSKTSLSQLCVFDLIENNGRNEQENKNRDDVVSSHLFQNNRVTSSTNEGNPTGEFSIELLKKYKNNLRPNATKKNSRHIISTQIKSNVAARIKNNKMSRRNNVIPQVRNNVVPQVKNNVVPQLKNDVPRVGYNVPQLSKNVVQEVRNNIIPNLNNTAVPQVRNISTENWATNGKKKKCQESCRNSSQAMSSSQEQRTFAQFPSGYVQLHPQNCYQPSCMSAGIIWKPIDSANFSAMSMNNFSIPNAQNVPIPVSQVMNMHRNKCLCNCCNMNHQQNTAAFPRERISKLQYVIAIPVHETPAHFIAHN